MVSEVFLFFTLCLILTHLSCGLLGYSIYKLVKHSKRKVPFEAILQKMPQGILVFDPEFWLSYKNSQIDQLFPHFDIQKFQYAHLKQFASQEHQQSKCIKILENDFLVQRIKLDGWVILAFELSEQKKIHQIGKDFVANASHELRTPITIIKGFAETLKDLPEISDAMLNDFTDKILRSCHRMDNLVKNLLLLADLDHSKRINPRDSDLIGLIESVSYTLVALHPDVCIETLTSHSEIMLSFDPDMLEQAILNLLENAVKYSAKPASITMVVEKKQEGVTLKIQDKGFGISEEHLPYIFQRFYRVNQDRSRKLGGAGLGLSIVQAIIEKHGATIKASSKLAEGTTFEIFFKEKMTDIRI